ncbi:MAG TPA: mandelate racemase/muconate lactonizing enzyme family protein [Opitutaceae bacterium]|nr:mandelate racemase/muconate lactonizing enzyme family protein [Opitutaceae bacterium]
MPLRPARSTAAPSPARRRFLRQLVVGAAAASFLPRAFGALPKAKITRVQIYRPPNLNLHFNQSNMVVVIETDQAGLIGVGEGGSRDTLEQCAQRLVGRNPFDLERCWQDMYRSWFYPPGREKIHALGALDLALWDLKGKALGVPVYDLIGGMNRTYVETYLGGGGSGTQLQERARAAIEAGHRAFRMDAASVAAGGPVTEAGPLPGPIFNTHERVRQVAKNCRDARIGVGENGDWLIDLHQRFDYADALRCCKAIEEFEPYLVEDPTRDEQFRDDIPKLRRMTTVPLAAGEEWGQRWDFHRLVENKDIDYVRCTLPNVGGITEMLKVAALCETHAVGIVPHFTGSISTAALVHALGPFSGPVLVEIGQNRTLPEHISEGLDFRRGKLWPAARPGLGITLNMERLTPVATIADPGAPRPIYFRPDGSQTSW